MWPLTARTVQQVTKQVQLRAHCRPGGDCCAGTSCADVVCFAALPALLRLQLPERVQQLSAGATSVLFDFDRLSGYQHAPLRQALSAAAGRGKAVPLKPLMHRWGSQHTPLGTCCC